MRYSIWTIASVIIVSAGIVVSCGGDDPVSSARCGNFELEASETCDDGNVSTGDGCGATCTIEPGWTCATSLLTSCTPTCGDGLQVGAEPCDDGNQIDGDGCSASCVIDIEAVCDDAADNDGDGEIDCADADCVAGDTCIESEVCTGGVDEDIDNLTDCEDPDCADDSACAPFELCDDGVDNDTDELTDCADVDDCDCSCGDGVPQDGELCDNGSDNSATVPDACRPDCRPASCGDSVVDTGEACDNGESNGPGNSCLTDCVLGDILTCGPERTLFDLNTFEDGDGVWRTEISPVVAWSNDTPVPPVCGAVNSLDAALRFVSPDDATYAWYVRDPDASRRVAFWLQSDCADAVTECLQPEVQPLGPAFQQSLGRGDVRWLRVDSSAGGTGSLEIVVTRIDEILEEGSVCESGNLQRPCGAGLVCGVLNSGSGFVCRVPPILPGRLGQPCTSATPTCEDGLTCSEAICELSPGASCDLPVVITADEVADGVTVRTGSAALRLPFTSVCGAMSTGGVFAVTAPGDGVIVAEGSAAPAGLLRLAVREVCDLPVSELGCDSASNGSESVVEWNVTDGQVVYLVATGLPSRDIRLRFLPTVPDGGTCDRAGLVGRCDSGLYCNASGICEVAPVGTCANPIEALVEGVGDLVGRGLVVGVDTRTAPNSLLPSCSTDGADRVYGFTAPQSGLLTAQVVSDRGAASVAVRRNCETTRDAIECTERSAVVSVRAGDRLFIIVESTNRAEALEGSLVLVLAPRSFPPDSCSTTSCITGSECMDGACVWTPVSLGSSCVAGDAPCETGTVCYAALQDTVCAREIPFEGEICDPTGLVGPSCGIGLECRFVEGEEVCTRANFEAGTPCRDNADCASSLTCEGLPSVCTVPPPRRNDPCDPEVANSCGTTTGLSCQNFGREDFRCDFPRVGEGGVCSESISCDVGLDCVVVSGEGRCRPLGQDGDLCSSGGELPRCVEPLSCTNIGGELRCASLGGAGASCTGRSECQLPYYCSADNLCTPRLPPGATCMMDGPEEQCAPGLTCRSGETGATCQF